MCVCHETNNHPTTCPVQAHDMLSSTTPHTHSQQHWKKTQTLAPPAHPHTHIQRWPRNESRWSHQPVHPSAMMSLIQGPSRAVSKSTPVWCICGRMYERADVDVWTGPCIGTHCADRQTHMTCRRRPTLNTCINSSGLALAPRTASPLAHLKDTHTLSQDTARQTDTHAHTHIHAQTFTHVGVDVRLGGVIS